MLDNDTVHVYDAPDCFDRYTVIVQEDGACFGMSRYPHHPQHVNMFVGELGRNVEEGDHLGELVDVAELPAEVQQAILNRLSFYEKE